MTGFTLHQNEVVVAYENLKTQIIPNDGMTTSASS